MRRRAVAGIVMPVRDVELVVGEPIWFDSTMDHATATTRLEAAMSAL